MVRFCLMPAAGSVTPPFGRPLSPTASALDWPNLTVVSVAPLIAAALSRILADGSIGDLS